MRIAGPAFALALAAVGGAAQPSPAQSAAESSAVEAPAVEAPAPAVQPPASPDQPLPPLPGESAGRADEPAAAPRDAGAARTRRVATDIEVPLGFPPDTLNLKLARALERAGVDRAWLAPDARAVAMWGGGEGSTPLFDYLFAAPDRAPDILRVLGAAACGAAGTAADLVLFAGQRAGFGVRRGLVASPHAGRWDAAADSGAFQRALEAIATRPRFGAAAEARDADASKKGKGKGKPPGIDVKTAGDVPPDARRLAAFLLGAAGEALAWRDEALAGLTRGGAAVDLDSLFLRLVRAYASGDSADDALPTRETEALLARIDLPLLHAGAMDLALALDEARAKADSLALAGDYHLEAETPLGTVVLDGTQSTRYEDPGPYLLIVDAGGHDTYWGGATTYSAATPVSLILEIAGDDEYVAADSAHPSWGGACLGYAALVDVAGNDTYRGVSLTLGAGLAGVGVLIDRAGDDRYDAVTFAEGAARHGVGVLGDLGGRDRYRAFQAAQGFGGPRGAGVLADSSGDDIYVAEDAVVRFPSAQTAKHNTSLAQGAGCGKRADLDDGRSLAGGVGLLADGGGADVYRCGVFGQGVGYWYGVGVLFDAAGRDTFEGVWYAQGAAAHFAFGALLDLEGNDVYRATDNMAQGAGHDFSVGLFMDVGGSDVHEAPNLSLGGGNANGVGLFLDDRGDDAYRTSGEINFGRGDSGVPHGGLRDLFPTTGVFLDGGGRDEYPPARTAVGNGKSWRQEGALPALTTEIGIGDDRP
jgi:hypothetical protein